MFERIGWEEFCLLVVIAAVGLLVYFLLFTPARLLTKSSESAAKIVTGMLASIALCGSLWIYLMDYRSYRQEEVVVFDSKCTAQDGILSVKILNRDRQKLQRAGTAVIEPEVKNRETRGQVDWEKRWIRVPIEFYDFEAEIADLQQALTIRSQELREVLTSSDSYYISSILLGVSYRRPLEDEDEPNGPENAWRVICEE